RQGIVPTEENGACRVALTVRRPFDRRARDRDNHPQPICRNPHHDRPAYRRRSRRSMAGKCWDAHDRAVHRACCQVPGSHRARTWPRAGAARAAQSEARREGKAKCASERLRHGRGLRLCPRARENTCNQQERQKGSHWGRSVSVELSRLANGLTVVSHARADVETVSLGIWVGAGSRSGSLPKHGVAPLLEHMAFKGTDRRSAQAIAEEIEAVGGELNAATGIDSTAYYARVLRQDAGLALDILSDIILAPRFDRTELSRERNVILQEIASAQDSPEDMVF